MNSCSEDVFWHFINERHQVYLNRKNGLPKPWTADPILRDWKFVNVFRELDPGTIWLRENFLEPHMNCGPQILAFNICWYRMFNWRGTGALLGFQVNWNPTEVTEKLEHARANGEQVFTGAHIIWSPPGWGSKAEFIANVCRELCNLCHEPEFYRLFCVTDSGAGTLGQPGSAEAIYNHLTALYGVGPFMAYQMILDMMHTPLLEHAADRYTWAVVGPGAYRGLQRLYPGIRRGEGLAAMLELTEKSRLKRGLHVPPLDVHDVEFVLCEVSKYCKVLFGEGRPRSTYPGGA